MLKELSASLIFTFAVYIFCQYNYQPQVNLPHEKLISLTSVEFPIDLTCKLTKKSSLKELKYQEITRSLSKSRIVQARKFYRNLILPKPSKLNCAAPSVIKEKLEAVINIPQMPKIKKEIVIAVIDTGIDLTNPYLSKRIYLPPFLSSINDFDFSSEKKIQDEHGHGSHVAGIILAVFPNARILPLKYYNAKATGQENLDSSIKAIQYAIDQKVDIINYSGGGPEDSEAELAVLTKARQKGIIVVAAAGNEKAQIDAQGGAYYPASYELDNIITVGNLNKQGSKHLSSNFGINDVDLFAPGETILSYVPDTTDCLWKMTGTSMSAPLVTATIAIIKASNPKLNYKEVRDIVLGSVKVQANLLDISKTGGTLDIYRSVASLPNQNKKFKP